MSERISVAEAGRIARGIMSRAEAAREHAAELEAIRGVFTDDDKRTILAAAERIAEDGLWTCIRSGTIDTTKKNGATVVTGDTNIRITPSDLRLLMRDEDFDCFQVEVRIRPIVGDVAFAKEFAQALSAAMDAEES